MSEGDSISVYWSGNHTGIFMSDHAGLTFYSGAVAGSGIAEARSRLAADLANGPAIMTVFIGGADLENETLFPTVQSWIDAMLAYTDSIRAAGVKVAVGTILPRTILSGSNAADYTAKHNARRLIANQALRAAAAAGRIDGIIDFAADPEMGPDSASNNLALYQDGTHPTDGCGYGCGGQGKLAVVYRNAVEAILRRFF